jgi:L-alanine-DL-glutamate epimerase-like enolase superfamily enzyme
MKIETIETSTLELPYTKPLITATNHFTVARGVLVKVVTDVGVEGYGYSDLFPRTGETPETARHVIDAVLKPKINGRSLKIWLGYEQTWIMCSPATREPKRLWNAPFMMRWHAASTSL